MMCAVPAIPRSRDKPGLRCLVAAVALCCCLAMQAQAQAPLRCAAFTQDVLAAPEPREAAPARRRYEAINAEARAHSYPVLFLGDSLTERWHEVAEDRRSWDRYFAPLGALNAGINGDRTEHLLWRIEHGNIENQHPDAVVLLIGTNDLGHGRSPEDAAEGIRRVLMNVRQRLPQARILLEGLWPRNDVARIGAEIEPVNQRIRQCADGDAIVYADTGRFLLDGQGRLTHAVMPDGLHPSPQGYEIVSPHIRDALMPLLSR